MEIEEAAVIQDASDFSHWLAQQVVTTDRLIVLAEARPLSPQESVLLLRSHRELLVRLSQSRDLISWATEMRSRRRTPLWRRLLRWLLPGRVQSVSNTS